MNLIRTGIRIGIRVGSNSVDFGRMDRPPCQSHRAASGSELGLIKRNEGLLLAFGELSGFCRKHVKTTRRNLTVNRHHLQQAKDADRLGPKGTWSAQGLKLSLSWTNDHRRIERTFPT